MRHRRRCQGPSKPPNRRKACNACVQAKTKCCYSQPTCSRCAKRGIPCVYVTYSNSYTDSAMDLSGPSDGTDTPTDVHTPVSTFQGGEFEATAEPLELSLWDAPLSSWPLEPFDMPLPTAVGPTVTLPQFNSIGIPYSSPGVSAGLQSRSGSVMSLSSPTWNIPFPMPIAPPLSEIAASAGFTNSPPMSLHIVRLLGEYPSQLLKEEFTAPFLHRTLYSDTVPDMTSLPLTSMAICCSSGVTSREGVRFVRRAMDAERQRLIESFVSATDDLSMRQLTQSPAVI
jgi:hypothetical protein